MFLESIRLRNFRIYERLDFEFPSETTIFLGSNGVGKTSILEAVYVFSALQSFRTSRLKDFIQTGSYETSAHISCRTDVKTKLSYEIFENKPKTLQKNGKNVRGPKFIEDLRIVALVPEHQKLLDSSSLERRKFLDRLVYSLDPSFLDTSRRYEKALRHKRALFRKDLPWSVFADQVAVWNTELVRCAEVIRRKRNEASERLQRFFVEEHAQIGEGEVRLVYEPAEEDLGQALLEKSQKEHAAGRVLYGPHRDDLVVTLRNRKAHQGASQGERSSLLLALKFAEIRILQENSDLPMLLLLDDLGATLDPKRRSKLFERTAKEKVQTLITTTDQDIADAAKAHEKNVSEVHLDDLPAGFSFAPRSST